MPRHSHMLLVRHPDSRVAERRYVLEVVLGEFLGLEWEARAGARGRVEICLADEPSQSRLRMPDTLLSIPDAVWLRPASLPRPPLPRWRCRLPGLQPKLVEEHLPVLYGNPGPRLVEEPEGLSCGIDLLGGIFFQLTRYEEIVDPQRDQHGRFPAEASLAHREGFLQRPLVNEYLELLRSLLERLWPGLPTRRRSFRQLLSHDIDVIAHPHLPPGRLLRGLGGDVLRRRDPGLAAARLRGIAARWRRRPERDPYHSFSRLMQCSEELGLRSAFYFMVGCTDPRFDTGYRLEQPHIAEAMREIHRRGHEIGLHPSFGTYLEPGLIHREYERLRSACTRLGIEQPAWGGRQHFLRWRNPDTWRGWDQAGLTYDSTLGYPRDPGFRCGTCFEFPVFDLRARRSLSLRERPLVVMELTVIDHEGRAQGHSLTTLLRLREICRRFEGDFTLLWHNDRLASPRERSLYRTALTGENGL